MAYGLSTRMFLASAPERRPDPPASSWHKLARDERFRAVEQALCTR